MEQGSCLHSAWQNKEVKIFLQTGVLNYTCTHNKIPYHKTSARPVVLLVVPRQRQDVLELQILMLHFKLTKIRNIESGASNSSSKTSSSSGIMFPSSVKSTDQLQDHRARNNSWFIKPGDWDSRTLEEGARITQMQTLCLLYSLKKNLQNKL